MLYDSTTANKLKFEYAHNKNIPNLTLQTCLRDYVFGRCSRVTVQDGCGGFYPLPPASPRPPSRPALARKCVPDDHVLSTTLRSDEDERLSILNPRFYHAQGALCGEGQISERVAGERRLKGRYTSIFNKHVSVWKEGVKLYKRGSVYKAVSLGSVEAWISWVYHV